MKIAIATAALAATVLFACPANTQTGMDFYNQCGTGAQAGFFNHSYCHGYLLGFYNALGATGQLCPRVVPNETQVVMVVQNWLRFHAASLDNPENIMIRNAILKTWGCRR